MEIIMSMNKIEKSKVTDLFQDLPFGIGIISDRKIIYSNKSLCQMLGYSTDNIYDLNIDDIFFKKIEMNRFIENLSKNNSKKSSWETKVKHKNGKAISIIYASSKLYEDSSTSMFTAVDITNQYNIEQYAKECEGHVRSLMESATSFAVYRLEHDKDSALKLKVVFVSPSIKEIVGISDHMRLQSWYDTIHPDDLDRVIASNQTAFSTLEFNDTWRIIHPIKKEIRWIHAIAKPVMDPNGEVKYVNGIFIDVTEQKIGEQNLKDKEKELQDISNSLEEINAALRVLVKKRDEDQDNRKSTISSDINNYINPYIEKLRDTAENHAQKTMLDIIKSNLNEIVSPLPMHLASKNLTHSEFQIANLIKLGKTSLEISKILNLSVHTIDTHRRNIRKKLGLLNDKGSLRTYLLNLQ